ncbi:NtaA/DmoA family FMN-dependent monooxygenase [Xylophilus sp.]|uniref:NtaA/DmoA family FMN-dependent monooxygenase n=1 Tax=Xylophilus sp. TaxID=2653893 RepID=UPI0013BB0501|nr:NtaA/DmoA family FMN-dependent monooxygenase [Xylophilus sp.]KAF1047544.1 MAG: Dimethyl-sulfide monooxygenase [Xylophilus sp.]
MSKDKKQLHVNLFEMACVVHHSTGLWAEPGDQRPRIAEIGFWTELAQLLDHGGFDALFLADVLGVYDHLGLEEELLCGHQIPTLDPLSLIPAMAAVTSGLGFGATFSTTYEPPFAFARRASTLDFLTHGRFAWNIVTSYLTNAAENFGLGGQLAHDDRSRIADEYLDVLYKLWEGSWDDDAFVLDRARRVVFDPAKVRYIDHVGEHFRVKGPHLTHPSPQRTPFLFQATGSNAGKEFAARHAEALFTFGSAENRADVRARLVRHGRQPGDIKFFPGGTIITGRSDLEVKKKEERYHRVIFEQSPLHPARLGVDLRRFQPEETVGEISQRREPGWERIVRAGYGIASTTIGSLIERQKSGGRFGPERGGFYVAGTPKVAADAVEKWLDEDGIDGINLRQFASFETARDFIELVVPELRSRGRYREAYVPGETLRERVFGAGRARLPDYHFGARYRDPAKLREPRPPLVYPEVAPEVKRRESQRDKNVALAIPAAPSAENAQP